MGEAIAKWIIGLQIFGALAALIIIIVLIFRRIKISKQEHFEKRDN